MKLGDIFGSPVYHSTREDFGALLRAALSGEKAYAALGPMYGEDPGLKVLAPFIRSAKESGRDPDLLSPEQLAPDSILEMAREYRRDAIVGWELFGQSCWRDAEDWTRAGLVLEIASRQGIHLIGGLKHHVKWKMKGTVTGRFGVEHGSYNPMTIPKEKRNQVIPSGRDRSIVVFDFRGMDVCSMISLFPSLAERYAGAKDLHARTAELIGVDRDVAKKEIFVFAYGGHSPYDAQFRTRLPELIEKKGGDLARQVQERSALAFRAGLSAALPFLTGDDAKPMFTVHDELVLDVLSGHDDLVEAVANVLSSGASERIGTPYTVGMKFGKNYAEAKS